MSSERFRRVWPWVLICSVWPLVVPVLWYGRTIQGLHRASSPEILAGLPEALRLEAIRLNTTIAAGLLNAAIKFVAVMFLFSAATCLAAEKRMRTGASWRRAAVDVMVVTLVLGAIGVVKSALGGDVNLSLVDPRPTEHFWPSLFPGFCTLAAGLSFVVALRRGSFTQQAA